MIYDKRYKENEKVLRPFKDMLIPVPGYEPNIDGSKRKGAGKTEFIINFLKNKKKFHLFLAPDGALSAARWSSGFYHIAKGLNVPSANACNPAELKS